MNDYVSFEGASRGLQLNVGGEVLGGISREPQGAQLEKNYVELQSPNNCLVSMPKITVGYALERP